MSRLCFDREKQYWVVIKRGFNCGVLLVVFYFGGAWLMAKTKTPVANTSDQAIKSFLSKAAEGKITRAEVYYTGWQKFTRAAITEDSLRSTHYDYMVTFVRPSLTRIEKALMNFPFNYISKDVGIDVRLGCIFYAGDEETLRIFFANNLPIVTINSEHFKATPELITAVLQFLPNEAREEIYYRVLENWISMSAAGLTKDPDVNKLLKSP